MADLRRDRMTVGEAGEGRHDVDGWGLSGGAAKQGRGNTYVEVGLSGGVGCWHG
jgi:hypothetical protein